LQGVAPDLDALRQDALEGALQGVHPELALVGRAAFLRVALEAVRGHVALRGVLALRLHLLDVALLGAVQSALQTASQAAPGFWCPGFGHQVPGVVAFGVVLLAHLNHQLPSWW